MSPAFYHLGECISECSTRKTQDTCNHGQLKISMCLSSVCLESVDAQYLRLYWTVKTLKFTNKVYI